MRRTLISVLVALAAVVLLSSAVLARGTTSTVTRPRLERSLSATFANLYVQQSHVLGRHDLTPGSLHARAMCDKHGPDVADVGPGGDWVCLVGWDDPQRPLPLEGYGKFELNVHSNDCYTVSGPSKLTGFLTITDTAGNEVTNPVFEFDGCFDPAGDDSPTGVEFPSLLSLTHQPHPRRPRPRRRAGQLRPRQRRVHRHCRGHRCRTPPGPDALRRRRAVHLDDHLPHAGSPGALPR